MKKVLGVPPSSRVCGTMADKQVSGVRCQEKGPSGFILEYWIFRVGYWILKKKIKKYKD